MEKSSPRKKMRGMKRRYLGLHYPAAVDSAPGGKVSTPPNASGQSLTSGLSPCSILEASGVRRRRTARYDSLCTCAAFHADAARVFAQTGDTGATLTLALIHNNEALGDGGLSSSNGEVFIRGDAVVVRTARTVVIGADRRNDPDGRIRSEQNRKQEILDTLNFAQ